MGIERHELRPAAAAIIPPAERDAIVGHADQPGIGDSDTMSVAAEIGKHLFRSTEGRLGIDHPVKVARLGQQAGEGSGSVRPAISPKNLRPCASKAARSSSRKRRRNRRDSTRTGKKKHGLHEIQRVPSGETPPPGTMQCRWGW